MQLLVIHSFQFKGVQRERLSRLSDGDTDDLLKNQPGLRRFCAAVDDSVDLGNKAETQNTPGPATRGEQA